MAITAFLIKECAIWIFLNCDRKNQDIDSTQRFFANSEIMLLFVTKLKSCKH